MQSLELLVETARWPEVREPELAPRVLDAIAQHVERSPAGDLAREPAEEARLHVGAVVLFQLRPFLWLSGQEEVHDVGRDQAEPAFVVRRTALVEAAGQGIVSVFQRRLLNSGWFVRVGVRAVPQQRGLDGVFERALGDLDGHAASFRTSILPVTAAEIRAVRYSFERWMACRILSMRESILAVSRSRHAAI